MGTFNVSITRGGVSSLFPIFLVTKAIGSRYENLRDLKNFQRNFFQVLGKEVYRFDGWKVCKNYARRKEKRLECTAFFFFFPPPPEFHYHDRYSYFNTLGRGQCN